jgi:hypothetical protein
VVASRARACPRLPYSRTVFGTSVDPLPATACRYGTFGDGCLSIDQLSSTCAAQRVRERVRYPRLISGALARALSAENRLFRRAPCQKRPHCLVQRLGCSSFCFGHLVKRFPISELSEDKQSVVILFDGAQTWLEATGSFGCSARRRCLAKNSLKQYAAFHRIAAPFLLALHKCGRCVERGEVPLTCGLAAGAT